MGELYDLKRERLIRSSEYEFCVVCGARTAVRRSLSVDQRDHYVEGAGQLCPSCYDEIYVEGGGNPSA